MIPRKRGTINSNLPGGWETAPPYGGRLVIKRQEQGWKGDKPRTRRGDLAQQVAKVNESEGCACVKRPFDFAQGRLAERANAG